jgi:hypothetical protein
VLVRLLAELFSGRFCDRAGYCQQRRRNVELAEGGAESRAGRMLLVAWLGSTVERLVHTGQRGLAVNCCYSGFAVD